MSDNPQEILDPETRKQIDAINKRLKTDAALENDLLGAFAIGGLTDAGYVVIGPEAIERLVLEFWRRGSVPNEQWVAVSYERRDKLREQIMAMIGTF